MPRLSDRSHRVTYQARRAAVLLLAWAMVVVGVAGLVLPVIPGLLFLFLGLALLAAESVWASRMMDGMVRRWPRTERHVGAARNGAHRVHRTIVGRKRD